MPHSFSMSLYHCTFGTKHRRPMIDPAFRHNLWAYMGGIARRHNARALAVGGVEDHAHLLLSLPATMAIAKALALIKSGSSKWVSRTIPEQRAFAWQEGYAAFSIGKSQIDVTTAYIANQEKHHRSMSFEDEYRLFLLRNGVEFDERFLWD